MPRKKNYKPRKDISSTRNRRLLVEMRMEEKRLKFIEIMQADILKTITAACEEVGIDRGTYYGWCEKHPEMQELRHREKNRMVGKAVSVVEQKIDEGDVETAKWLLERLDKQTYGKNVQINHTSALDKLKESGIEVTVVRKKIDNIQDVEHEEIKPEEHE